MNSNPTSVEKPYRELRPRPRFADLAKLKPNTWNSWGFLFWLALTAINAFLDDLQRPLNRVTLFFFGLMAVGFGIFAIQDRLEQRIATLLDRLEQKGVLSAEERAAIGIVPAKTIDADTMRGVWLLALIVIVGTVVVIGLMFFFAARSGTR